jgi:hypothetical protein
MYDAFKDPEANSTGAVVGGEQQPADLLPPALQAQQQVQEQPQQQQMVATSQHIRHQRRFHQQLSGPTNHQQQRQQQQYSGLQQLQPVVCSFQRVHLLQRIAGISSWTAAAAVLQQQQHSMQAEHIALLWSCLTPKLQAQQQAAARRASSRATAPQDRQPLPQHSATLHPDVQQQVQVQQAVMQRMSPLTGQFASSMGPQAMVATLQGLAAAAAAGRVSPGAAPAVAAGDVCMALDRQLQQLLQQQLLQVAGSCSPQQLATCLSSCQQLGWCCHTHSSGSSSQSVCQYCAMVLQEGSKGQLGAQLVAGSLSSTAAAHLVHSLAGCVAEQSLQRTQQQDQQQQDSPQEQPLARLLDTGAAAAAFAVVSDMLPQLADSACRVLAQGAGASVAVAELSGIGSSSGADGLSDPLLAAAVCSLQAFALLQHMPDPSALEQLLADLQPHVAAGSRLDSPQLLSLLLSCQQLGIEPWPEWLHDCYSALSSSSSSGMQGLGPGQLLQLLGVLGGMTNLQPSRRLLHQLAKMTAVHCSSYSLQQLASLPAGLQALGFRPEPYWLTDYYVATGRALLGAQQQQGLRPRAGRQKQRKQSSLQQQQQEGPVVSAAGLAQMLSGVGWLATAAPPGPWLQAVEAALLEAAAWEASWQQQQQEQQQQQHQGTGKHASQHASSFGQRGGVLQGGADVLHARMPGQFGKADRPQLWLPPACAAVVARVLGQWGHTPCSKLQEVLSVSLQDQHTSGSGGGGGTGDDAAAAEPAPAVAVSADQSGSGLSNSAGSSSGSSWHGAELMPGDSVVSAVVGRSSADVQQPHAVGSSDGTFSFDSDEQLDWLQGLEVPSAAVPAVVVEGESMAHQLAELSLAGRLGRGRPLAKSWYRSKLLQLVKGSRQKHALVL